MKRDIDQQLLDWKHDSARRALLVRGARQVGKTYSVRELGRTFANYLEVNFEEDPDVGLFFRDSPDPVRLREKLAVYYSTPIVPGETLLFLDEIQSCPEAFSSLRFFYEKMPDLQKGRGMYVEKCLPRCNLPCQSPTEVLPPVTVTPGSTSRTPRPPSHRHGSCIRG